MLFNFANQNNSLGIDITNDSIRVIELGIRGDFIMLINYIYAPLYILYNLKDINHFVYKLDNSIVDIFEKILSDNQNINISNSAITISSKYYKRILITLPKETKGMEDIILPLEINKYYSESLHDQNVLDIYDMTFTNYISDKNYIYVDLWDKSVIDIVKNLKQKFLPDLKLNNTFDQVMTIINIDKNEYNDKSGIIINFNLDHVSFGVYSNKKIIYIDHINSGLFLIIENLKKTFNLSSEEAFLIVEDYKKSLNNTSNITVDLKQIYKDNIYRTVYNVLLEIQSSCNNVIVRNNLNIKCVFLMGDLYVYKKDIINILQSMYKIEVVAIDVYKDINLNILENNNFFQSHKDSMSIAALNALNILKD